MIEKGLEQKSYRVKGIQENFEKGYVKVKKSGNEGECLSILRGAKKVSMEERHNKCQKSTPKKKKIKFHVFWCV